jgi:hypothetical protein
MVHATAAWRSPIKAVIAAETVGSALSASNRTASSASPRRPDGADGSPPKCIGMPLHLCSLLIVRAPNVLVLSSFSTRVRVEAASPAAFASGVGFICV